MFKSYSKYFTAISVFLGITYLSVQDVVASDDVITGYSSCLYNASAPCKTTYTGSADDGSTLQFNGSSAHRQMKGAYTGVFSAGAVGALVLEKADSVVVLDGAQDVDITVNTGSSDRGINQDIAHKNLPALYSKIDSSVGTLNVVSGSINSGDTAVFLTESNDAGTDIIVGEDGTINGSRYAIRQDVDTTLGQTDSNSFTDEAEYDAAVANANEGGAGKKLILRVQNAGNIYSNPITVSQPINEVAYDDESVNNDGIAFMIGGNNRVAKEVEIANAISGVIYGSMLFGGYRGVIKDIPGYNDTSYYVQSVASIVNNGTIIANRIFSDHTTKLTIVNNAGATLKIGNNPLVITGENYEVYENYTDVDLDLPVGYDKTYTPDTIGEIRMDADDSSVTNYGTMEADINSNMSTQSINLYGGTYQGTINFAGTLNLGNDFTADIVGDILARADQDSRKSGATYGARINFGSRRYNLISGIRGDDGKVYSGNFEMRADDTDGFDTVASVGFSQNDSDGVFFGGINAEGTAILEKGAKLNIETTETYSYLESGKEYLIIDGNTGGSASGSDVEKVEDDHIMINDVGGNSIGNLEFSTVVLDVDDATPGSETYHDLAVVVTRKSASELTENEEAIEIFEAIDEVGGSSTGALRELQEFYDISGASASEIEAALISAGPVNNGNIELATMVPIHEMLKVTDARIDRFIDSRREHIGAFKGKLRGKIFTLCNPLGMHREDDELSPTLEELRLYCQDLEGDIERKRKAFAANYKSEIVNFDITDPQQVWGKVFGTKSTKDGQTSYGGFDSETKGFTVGTDWLVDNRSLVGIALSYSKSNISSHNDLKDTDINTYQLTLYGTRFYENNYFWNAALGIALHEYSSSRIIPVASVTANSNYDGQSYIAKIRGGKIYNSVNDTNFDIIPEISATFVQGSNSSYTETGANTLNLNVDGGSDKYLEGRIGFNVHYNKLKLDDSGVKSEKIRYRFHNSYAYNFLNETKKTTARFVGNSSSFTTTSEADDAFSMRLGLGVDIPEITSGVLSLDYSIDLMRSYIAHTGSIKFSYEF